VRHAARSGRILTRIGGGRQILQAIFAPAHRRFNAEPARQRSVLLGTTDFLTERSATSWRNHGQLRLAEFERLPSCVRKDAALLPTERQVVRQRPRALRSPVSIAHASGAAGEMSIHHRKAACCTLLFTMRVRLCDTRLRAPSVHCAASDPALATCRTTGNAQPTITCSAASSGRNDPSPRTPPDHPGNAPFRSALCNFNRHQTLDRVATRIGSSIAQAPAVTTSRRRHCDSPVVSTEQSRMRMREERSTHAGTAISMSSRYRP